MDQPERGQALLPLSGVEDARKHTVSIGRSQRRDRPRVEHRQRGVAAIVQDASFIGFRDAAPMTDRDEIIEVVNRYAWALDLKRFDRLAEVFTADVEADYDGPRWTGRDRLVSDMARFHNRVDGTQHLIGSHLVRVDDDTARSTSSAHVVITRRDKQGWLYFSMGARYDDELQRTPDGWRICRRTARAMWRAGDREVLT